MIRYNFFNHFQFDLVDSRIKLLENQPKKNEIDDEERIKSLEFMMDNIKAEINVISGKKINELKNDLEEKISGLGKLEKISKI